MCSYFETYQPISMSRSSRYGQVLILLVHSLDACKRRCCQTTPLSQQAAACAGLNSFEAEMLGGQGLITASSATLWIDSTHHGISYLKINPILWELKGKCRVSQYSTTVTFSYLSVPSSFLSY